MAMPYEWEELMPIVGDLARKYTLGESTSMSYERAEALMEAVVYCIEAVGHFAGDGVLAEESLSAAQAYEVGKKLVDGEVKQALGRYNTLLATFDSYGNRCLAETVQKGLAAYFKWVDTRYAPQANILTFDYPVLADLHAERGVHRVVQYVAAVEREQQFLARFPRHVVCASLARYSRTPAEMVENLCEVFLTTVFAHWLVQLPLTAAPMSDEGQMHLQALLLQTARAALVQDFEQMLQALAAEEARDYFALAAENIVTRLRHGAQQHLLKDIL